MKILLAVDGSAYTQQMLGYLESHPELLGSKHQYVAITVVPALPAYATRHITRDIIDDYRKEQSEAALKPVRDFAARTGWNIECRFLIGDAAEQIAAELQPGGYDLVAMGTHGRGTVRNVVMGSVATRVVAASKVPVLLVR